jgi:acyl-CoA thioesterase-1
MTQARAWLGLLLSLLWLNAAAAEAPVILVLGDSLSAAYGIAPEQGWTRLLQQKLQAGGYPHRVENFSVSGDTTHGGRSRLPAALQRHQPALVVIELGANDGLRGLPLEDMRANLSAMITASQQAGAKVLLLGMRIPSNYGKAYAERFFQVYAELARQHSPRRVEFFLDGVALKPEFIQADGLHPTAQAQPRLLQNVWAELQPMLQSTAPP